jgi:hypothetical protein
MPGVCGRGKRRGDIDAALSSAGRGLAVHEWEFRSHYSVGRKSGIAGFSLTDAINKKRDHRAMQIYRPMI